MSMIKNFKSSVSDSPIFAQTDTLGNDKYATGLMRFIRSSDTPITVGIQGGWGSGKTSLINILRYHLESQGDTISVFVNAWEHSLFQNENDKSSVAINLLAGVVDAICQAIEDKAESTKESGEKSANLLSNAFQGRSSSNASFAIPDEIKRRALREGSIVKKMGQFAVGVATVGAKIGARMLANFETDDLKTPNSLQSEARQEFTSSRLIQQLRRDLTHAVNTICQETQYKRFVCFIDDLDRVHPKTAVEILDVLKNVFEIPNCVFILAIDYDVVVKGLKEKFGEKTSENEREFRQYFDKIIQVPFSMPISAYREKIDEFLRVQFNALGMTDSNTEQIAKMAWLATDGVPRGIKRIINTLSLLNQIKSDSVESGEGESKALEILFAVVALQINFPEIYQRLAKKPRFDEWTVEALWSKWNLDEGGIGIAADDDGIFDPTILAQEFGNSFDEDWEQVLYLLCQKNSWLQRKASDVSEFFNYLKEIVEEDGDNGWKYLSDALDAVHVTDVEAPPVLQSANEGASTRNDQVTLFMKNVHQQLLGNGNKHGMRLSDVESWAKKYRGERYYIINVTNPSQVYDLKIILQKDGKLKAEARLTPPRGHTTPFREHMESWVQCSDSWSQDESDTYVCRIPGDFASEGQNNESARIAAEALSELLHSLLQGIQSFRS